MAPPDIKLQKQNVGTIISGSAVVDKINAGLNKVRLRNIDAEGASFYETHDNESKTAI